jgi:hypothetical protein
MGDGKSFRDLEEAAWGHLQAERFDQAEGAFRQLIERVDPDDALFRWHLFGVLGGVLNMPGRAQEGTERYRQSLARPE